MKSINKIYLSHSISFLGLQETFLTKIDLFKIHVVWGNNRFEIASSQDRGHSGGIFSIWDPNVFAKIRIFCLDNMGCGLTLIFKFIWLMFMRLKVFMKNMIFALLFIYLGIVILDIIFFLDDFNDARCPKESGDKISKLDKFLVSERVVHSFIDFMAIALDRLDYRHIVLKNDNDKIKFLKSKIRDWLWFNNLAAKTKKQVIVNRLCEIDKLLDIGYGSQKLSIESHNLRS
uniref:Uncharacterized protein n=1 Tax=Lactuca sativa TaxID=4236 RepID=A0A9R1X2P3_LACSA|nr:hypothetical protein LSAT_V11C800410640 [Lactuca sativa]